jgi:hypothetical protein
MTRNEYHTDQVRKESRPETTVDISENADDDQCDTYIKTIFNNYTENFITSNLGCKDNLV